eukprot:TRINITY_DN6923_c0_g1_i2.p1 TRINITY_DN6923_c0_g1~~TRINITY_DN6923_c0_g1_i2.p1  ORF type:complete len:667 (+),score=82.21 TRINITY_DN6923_c0_g1_i2:42-2042(+)
MTVTGTIGFILYLCSLLLLSQGEQLANSNCATNILIDPLAIAGTLTFSASDTLNNGGYGHSASKLNDNYWDCSDSHGWHSQYSSTSTQHWVQVKTTKGIIPSSYSLKSRDGCYPSYPANNYKFLASSDGTNWVTLDTSTTSTSSWVTRTVSTSSEFTYFRWVFTATGYVEVYEARIQGCQPVTTTTNAINDPNSGTVVLSASDTLSYGSYGHSVTKLTDGLWDCVDSHGWHSGEGPTHWVKVQLQNALVPSSYSLKSRDGCYPNYPATNYQFLASQDNLNWTVLDTSTSNTGSWVKRVVTTTTAYRYFQWVFNSNGYVEIYEAKIEGTYSFSLPQPATLWVDNILTHTIAGNVTLTASDTYNNGGSGHSVTKITDGYWDCVNSHGWQSKSFSSSTKSWIQVKTTVPIVPASYSLKSREGCTAYAATSYQFRASNDGTYSFSLPQPATLWVDNILTNTIAGNVTLTASDTYNNGGSGHSVTKITDGYWDCVNSHGWQSKSFSSSTKSWIQVKTTVPIVPASYSLKSREGCTAYAATSYQFRASNDGTNWVTLDDSTESTQYWVTRKLVVGTVGYKYFQWLFPHTAYITIYEARIQGSVAVATSLVGDEVAVVTESSSNVMEVGLIAVGSVVGTIFLVGLVGFVVKKKVDSSRVQQGDIYVKLNEENL